LQLFQGSSYRHHSRYYYDDAVVSYGPGRSMLPDVVLHVPMESMRDVERVKQALAIEGVHRVRCDMATETVVVSGNVPPHTLLRRVKWIKRHSSIMSYGASYGQGASYGSEFPAYGNPYAQEQYPGGMLGGVGGMLDSRPQMLEYGSSDYGSPYERPYSSYSYY
jgi:hypothetical protein